MSDQIPFELQEKIIKSLPVKSLLKFRSVSKTWKSLIDSSDFIAEHAARHAHSHRLFVRCNDPITYKETHVCYIDDETFPQNKFTPIVPKSLRSTVRIVGSSYGLLCLYAYYHPSDFRHDMALLWNPLIRKSVSILVPNFLVPNLHRPLWENESILGFGVCPVTNDPKIVRILHFNRKVKAEVYTLSSGKWKSLLKNVPPKSTYAMWSQVVIGGFIYWVAFELRINGVFVSRTKNMIISFDITNESFRTIDLPNSLAQQPVCFLTIGKLRESLVICGGKQVYDVWMMEENAGVKIPFTRLFTFNPLYATRMSKLGFRESGELIMERKNPNDSSSKPPALFEYKPSSEYVNKLGIYGMSHKSSFDMISYTETLLLLDRSDFDIN